MRRPGLLFTDYLLVLLQSPFQDLLDGFQPGVIGDESNCTETIQYIDPATGDDSTVTCDEFFALISATLSDNVTSACVKILYIAAASFVLSYCQVRGDNHTTSDKYLVP